MELFKSAAAVASINFRKWLKDIRVRFIFLFMGYMMVYYMLPFTKCGMDTGRTITAWSFPILFRSGNLSVGMPKIVFHVGMLLLLCDAPFFSPVLPYVVLRSRRTSWCLGECLYILGAALIYTLFLALMSMVTVFPVITFGNDWGTVLTDAVFKSGGQTEINIADVYQFVVYPRSDVIRYLYPQGAHLYTFFAVWGSFSFLGLLMYLLSLMHRNVIWGMSAAGIFIFLDPLLVWLADGMWKQWVKLLSPVCWTSIDQLTVTDRFNFVSMQMALILDFVLILLLCGAIWRYSKRVVIELSD